MVIKVKSFDGKKKTTVKANNLAELFSKASDKLDYKIKKFVTEDDFEVDDDDVFQEIAENSSCLIAIPCIDKNDESSDKDDSDVEIKRSAKKPSRISVLENDDSDVEIKRSDKKQSRSSILKKDSSYDPSDYRKKSDDQHDTENDDDDGDDNTFYNLKKKANEIKKFEFDEEIDTAEYEKIKEIEINKKKKEEEKKKKYEKRRQELSQIKEETESVMNKKNDLKEQIEKAKFKSEISKMKSKSELNRLKSELAEVKIRQENIAILFEELKQAEKIDFCFMVDCTGSMSSYINEAKVVIHRIIKRLNTVFKDFALRVAFVGYRDIDDGSDRTIVFEFDSNADNFKSFVNNIIAKGGQDACEDVFGGLEEVTRLDWSHTTRLLFHIGDAPCHGMRFHNGCNDSHPSGDPRGLSLTNLLKFIVDNKINYYFAEINDSTFKMIDEFNKELRIIFGNEIKTFKLNNVKDLEMLATQSVIKSISDTKSTTLHSSAGSGKQMKKIAIDKTALEWSPSNFKKLKAEFYSANLDGDISDIASMKTNFTVENIEIEMCTLPFDKGSIRYAYAAFLNKKGKRTKYVLKESIFQNVESNCMSFYKDMIETQLVAIHLADIFSRESTSVRSLSFIDVNIVMLKENGKYYSIEEYLDGEFIKFNSNGGMVNEEKYTSTLDAFSHWTYQATNEYLLISDLQGFNLNKDTFLLTDPAIICADTPKRFGPTNLGQRGVKAFFSRHQCNDICRSLKLKKHRYQELRDRPKNMGTQVKK